LISSFKNYLVEETKVVYFTFGRMNPPTIGHEKLLTKLASSAKAMPYRVYLSQSQDSKKNPLQYKEKVKFARKMFPKHARQIMLDAKIKSVFDVMVKLYDEGFKRAIMVVGSDRVREFDVLLNKYNGQKGRHGFYNFEKIQVISAGERDPDADDVSGMSASKMRDAASDDDFTKFSQGMPRAISNADTRAIYNSVRKGLGLKEQKEFKNHLQLNSVSETREAYVSGSLYNVGDKVIIKETSEVAEIKVLGPNYVIVESQSLVQTRRWLDSIEVIEDYYKGLSKSTKDKRKAHFKKYGDKPDNDRSAYKPAPGDARAKTKPSKHTLKFRKMYGEDVGAAKERIARQKEVEKRRDAADAKRQDRIMDRARLAAARRKNRNSQP
jgi:hypothetical protein